MVCDFINHNPTEIVKIKGLELKGKILPNNMICYNVYSKELIIGDGISKYEELEPIHTSQKQIEEIKRAIESINKRNISKIEKIEEKVSNDINKIKSRYEIFLGLILIEFGVSLLLMMILLGLWK